MTTISQRPKQRGVSLIEILVALAIGAIIASALAVVFSQSIKSRERVNRDSQKIENGRYALDVISDDIRLAGYWGEFMPPADASWQTPSPCNTSTGTLGWLYNEITPNVPVPIQGFDGRDTALSTLPCLDNLKTDSSVLVLRRVSTLGVDPAGTLPGAAYLQTSSKTLELCGSADSQRFAFADSLAGLSLKWMDCTTAARAKEFIVRIYFIAKCNDADCALPDDQKIPTLKVAELKKVGGANKIEIRSVAPGVDDFRVIYGLDNTGIDGSVDGAYSKASEAGVLDPAGNWQDVVAARVFMVVRDIESTPGYDDKLSEKFGLGGVNFKLPTYDKAETFRRELVSTTVRLVNVAGRRGAP